MTSGTNLKEGKQMRPLKSQMFGAAASKGRGITSLTWKFPAVLAAVHLLAACRVVHDPYTTFQVNETPLEGLPLHLIGRIRGSHGYVLLVIMWVVIFGLNTEGLKNLDWFLLLVLSRLNRRGFVAS